MKKNLTIALLCLASLAQAQNNITVYDDNIGQNEEITLPDGMSDAALDSMLNEWNTRNYVTFDENCEAGLQNPEYSKEEYITRLSHLPNVVDMPYNEVVRKFIDQYSTRLRRTVSLMLGAGNFYNPIFEEALEAYGVPLELKYLPIIESALNPQATSRVGARGLWQFMIGTGKQYGLEVTSLVDERCDPVKASNAAAHYLHDLYTIFGDWTLVIASYNCGPNNVNKAIKRAGGSKDYWTIYPYLPSETRGYVPAFIAANYIMNYYCEHNICPVNTQLPAGTDTIMIDRDLRFEQIQEMCGVSLDELKALNPQYRTTLIPGSARPCTLRMTSQAINTFLEAGDSIYSHRAEELFAKKEVEVNETEVKQATTKNSSRSRSSKTITVRRGDNLGAIAARNHTTVAAIKRLNGMRSDMIREGQKLKVK